MSISKSIKKLFGKKKPNQSETVQSESNIKSPKSARKPGINRQTSRATYAALKQVGPTPRLLHGAFNESNAKLVTADTPPSGCAANYEHYSNFERKKNVANNTQNAPGRNFGILKPPTQNMGNNIYGQIGSQSFNPTQFNISDTMSDTGGRNSYEFCNIGAGANIPPSQNYQMFHPPRPNSVMRANSMSDLRIGGNRMSGKPALGANPAQIPRPGSALGFHGSMVNLPGANLQQFGYQTNQHPQMMNHNFLDQSASAFFDQSALSYQSPQQIEATIHKMEGFLAMLNSLQSQTNQVNQPQGNYPNFHPKFQNRPNLMMRPTVHQVQRSRSTLQPQPDFQERENRKKKKLRKKATDQSTSRSSDQSAFDMGTLKKKLEVISQEDSGSDSGAGSGTSSGSDATEKTTEITRGDDVGYFEGSSGNTTPDKQKSDQSGSDQSAESDSSDSSGDSSDSGVQTPPPQEIKKIKKPKLTGVDLAKFENLKIGNSEIGNSQVLLRTKSQ